jgi:hypothetical protein
MDDFFLIEYKFQSEQLLEKSWKNLLNKKINFQGYKVTMRKVLERHGNMKHVLGPELITDLITEGTAINIGGRLHVNEGYYEPRVLKRKIYLNLNVLKDTELDGEVFVVSGMTEGELKENSPSMKTVVNFSTGGEVKEIRDKTISLTTDHAKTSFSELCNKNQDVTLHWLKYIPEDQKLLWKQSRDKTDSLLDYVHFERTHGDKAIIRDFMKHGSQEVKENSIWGLKERTVFVVAEPGMGKTNTTTKTARQTKSADPTSWVVRINWRDHTSK